MTGLERLRNVTDGLDRGPWLGDVTRALYDTARQIEREQAELSEKEKLADSYKDALNGVCKALGLTDGTGLPEMGEIICAEIEHRLSEDHEIAEWVRERGGLEFVKNRDEFVTDMLAWVRRVSGIQEDENMVVEDAMSGIESRLMPIGMEWPRYEDGEKALLGDDAMGYADMGSFAIDHVSFFKNGEVTVCCEAGDDGKVENFARLFTGDRLNRPKQDPIGADGLPIKKCETVFGTESGCELIVDGFVEDGSHGPYTVDCHLENGGEQGYYMPNKLTHTKPEPPDSWEQIYFDCDLTGEQYVEKRMCEQPDGKTPDMAKAHDLVRRAEELAKRDKAE